MSYHGYMSFRLLAIIVLCAYSFFPAETLLALQIPTTEDLVISELRTVVLDGARDSQIFQFNDGRLVVDAGEGKSLWSVDKGLTWTLRTPQGPAMDAYKSAIDLGGGEIISLTRTTSKDQYGRFELYQQRSFDNWNSSQGENAAVNVPGSTASGGDDCKEPKANEGPLMHHGILKLANGGLIASMYGNFVSDTAYADGYPSSCNFKKYSTFVVFSSAADQGRTWQNPVMVATPDMGLTAREGFSESDLVQAHNGDLLIFMRSGGINKVYPHFTPTPLYMARSRDSGITWSTPVAIHEYGANPNAVVLGNGVIALTFGGGKGRVMFSDDNGETWKGKIQLTTSDSYTDVVAFGQDTIGLTYFTGSQDAFVITFLKIESYRQQTGNGLSFTADSSSVAEGQGVFLDWNATNYRNCVLSGGAWGGGTPVSAINSQISTGPLLGSTKFTLRCESIKSPGSLDEKQLTVAVVPRISTVVETPQSVPTSTPSSAPPTSMTSEAVHNERVRPLTTVNIRLMPSTTQPIVGEATPGMVGILTGERVSAGGYTWVRVRYDNGQTGWSIENRLTPLSSLNSKPRCPSLTRSLSKGARGGDVTQLQRFLIAQGQLGQGNDSGYFGLLTETAVKKFQCKHMSICSGSSTSNGYGVVGPRTRVMITSQCAM